MATSYYFVALEKGYYAQISNVQIVRGKISGCVSRLRPHRNRATPAAVIWSRATRSTSSSHFYAAAARDYVLKESGLRSENLEGKNLPHRILRRSCSTIREARTSMRARLLVVRQRYLRAADDRPCRRLVIHGGEPLQERRPKRSRTLLPDLVDLRTASCGHSIIK